MAIIGSVCESKLWNKAKTNCHLFLYLMSVFNWYCCHSGRKECRARKIHFMRPYIGWFWFLYTTPMTWTICNDCSRTRCAFQLFKRFQWIQRYTVYQAHLLYLADTLYVLCWWAIHIFIYLSFYRIGALFSFAFYDHK